MNSTDGPWAGGVGGREPGVGDGASGSDGAAHGHTADGWLQTNIDPLIKSAPFEQDELLIILFDESGSDNTSGGGVVIGLTASSKARRGYQSTLV